MCGRYTIGTDAAALEARFHAWASASRVSPSSNAAPSQGLPTILSANPHAITMSTWGFLPTWGRTEQRYVKFHRTDIEQVQNEEKSFTFR